VIRNWYSLCLFNVPDFSGMRNLMFFEISVSMCV